MPYFFGNNLRATSYGAEFFARLRVNRNWQLSSGYSFIALRGADATAGTPLAWGSLEGDSPKHEYQIRSNLNLRHGLEWDTAAYYVSTLRNGPVPSYTRLDTRVGWRVGESVEFSVGAQNLLAPRHFEFLDGTQVVPTLVERSIFGKVTWHF